MGFFAVLHRHGEATFDLHKLDINLIILPGVFGRDAVYCDVGLCLEIESLATNHQSDHRLRFDLALPFACEQSGIRDLVVLIRDDGILANLIFGNNAPAPRAVGVGYDYFDGERNLRFTGIDAAACVRKSADPRIGFSLWDISTDRPVVVGENIYLRMRFRITSTGRTWIWMNVPTRRAYAVADIRVNELRERPDIRNPPDFKNNMVDVGQVNCFVAAPPRFKAGRVSPHPKYVRVLEGPAWERYLDRRIGTKNSALIITYWQGEAATSDNPFRAFLEVEKRRPSSGRASLYASLLVLAGYVLLSPLSNVRQSIGASITVGAIAWAAGLSVGSLIAVWRIMLPMFTDKRYRLVIRAARRIERFRYRLR